MGWLYGGQADHFGRCPVLRDLLHWLVGLCSLQQSCLQVGSTHATRRNSLCQGIVSAHVVDRLHDSQQVCKPVNHMKLSVRLGARLLYPGLEGEETEVTQVFSEQNRACGPSSQKHPTQEDAGSYLSKVILEDL